MSMNLKRPKPGEDENELLEYFTCILGEIPEHLILSAKKYN
jgi:hypothetical protein